jgi:hypothetical protein
VRLTTDQLNAAWLHPRRLVRNVVASCFADVFTTDPDVTAHAIRAVDQFGWRKFLTWGHEFCKLPLATDAALEWVCVEVERTDDGAPSDNLKGHLAWMLSRADIALLERHAERVLGLPAIGPEERLTVLRRLELAACAPAEAWRRLDDHCRIAVASKTFADAKIPEAELLLEPLVRARSASIARVMDVLRAPLPTGTGDEPADWLTGLMIVLAGRLRVEEAAPLIWNIMAADWDWYYDEAVAALLRIGTPDVVRLVQDRYQDADWSTRLYATIPLKRIRCEESLAAIKAALACEDDHDLRAYLGAAAAAQFDDRLVPDALAVLGEAPTDPERGEIRELLVAFSYLSGLDLPERDAWERHVDAHDDRMSRFGDPAASPLVNLLPSLFDSDDEDIDLGSPAEDDEPAADVPEARGARVGRNEPCPCGSGKKYKRCCLLDGRGSSSEP